MEQLPCPNCGKQVDAPDGSAAREVVCPQCGTHIGPGSARKAALRALGIGLDHNTLTRSCKVLALGAFIPIFGLLFAALALVLGIAAIVKTDRAPLVAGSMGLAGVAVGVQLVLMIYVSSLGRQSEFAKRAICGANLNSIGRGIALYQDEFEDSFPWITDVSRSVSLAEATARPTGGADTVEDLAKKTSNIVENLNALVKQASASYKMFRCPSVGPDIAEQRITGKAGYNDAYGFWQRESPGGPGKYYCDYAFHIGYPNLSGGKNPAPINKQMDTRSALMADADVGEGNPPTLNSDWNHKTAGVNVLVASFSVSWVTPVGPKDSSSNEWHYPLVGEDNIYGDGGPDAAWDDPKRDRIPTNPQDQVLHSPR